MTEQEGRATTVAIVEDDAATRLLLRRWLEADGHRVVEHESARSMVEHEGPAPAVACIDLGLGEVSGLDLVMLLKAREPALSVVIVTAQRDIDAAVSVMRAGAYDYVTKPIDRERVLAAVRRASERAALLRNVQRLESQLSAPQAQTSLVGTSQAMQRLLEQVARVVQSDVPVCVFGESGTGKELVARAIHAGGPRRNNVCVAVNCGAIPATLQESELFGHERGAFTGALSARRGRFEEAHGGTLFLDELGEMSAGTQAALLRVLQEHSVRRVGGARDIPVNVRVVCATHRDLRKEVQAGRFREDLYFRLVVYPIQVPALRERLSDVPLLASHFIRKLSPDMGREAPRVAPEALDAMMRYRWPGNVRELQNAIHRALLSCDGNEMGLSHLPQEIREAALPRLTPPRAEPSCMEEAPLNLKEIERRAIVRALAVAKGRMAEAARMLGIGRATIYRKLSEYAIETSADGHE